METKKRYFKALWDTVAHDWLAYDEDNGVEIWLAINTLTKQPFKDAEDNDFDDVKDSYYSLIKDPEFKPTIPVIILKEFRSKEDWEQDMFMERL